MIGCPNCRNSKTLVLRTNPDPQGHSREITRHCSACGVRFVTFETHIRTMKTRDPRVFLRRLAAHSDALPAALRSELQELLQEPH